MTHRIALRAFVFSALACGMSATYAVASAQAEQGGAQIVVSVADINFETDQGARVALGRIEKAADLVCGGRPDLRDLSGAQLYTSCRREAVDQAVASLNRPLLSRLAPNSRAQVQRLASR